MEDDVFSALELHAHGLHESLTHRLAIAWIHVNVLAPQTPRAMIGVAAPAHKEFTSFADEVFLGTLEFFCIHKPPPYLIVKERFCFGLFFKFYFI